MAFHMLLMADLDPEFAKAQLLLLLREWYMHPNGQLPAYESGWSAVNPPVHAWSVWHVYRKGISEGDVGDLDLLERAFQKLLLNFTWWVNRNDKDGRNLFNGGFLGLDNICIFNRSETLPDGTKLNQADATAWVGLLCSVMLQVSLELARHCSKTYEDIASKFFEHYVAIMAAINTLDGTGLWNEEDGFYFDQVSTFGQAPEAIRARTIVGIVPLFAVCVLKRDTLEGLDGFKKRMDWFLKHKPHLADYLQETRSADPALHGSHWIASVPKERFARIVSRLFDEAESCPHIAFARCRSSPRLPVLDDALRQDFSPEIRSGFGTLNSSIFELFFEIASLDGSRTQDLVSGVLQEDTPAIEGFALLVLFTARQRRQCEKELFARRKQFEQVAEIIDRSCDAILRLSSG